MFSRIIFHFLLFAIFFPAAVSAQKSDAYISGTVSDTSGIPLSDVRVKFKDTRGGFKTDAQGKFFITVKEGQTYTLEFSYFDQKKQSFTTPVLQPGQQYEINVQFSNVHNAGTVTITEKVRNEK
ncbi:MAG: carboxypeptidase-like regulatory domain-containing protein, partial [Bacteroidia bacterium]